MYNILGTSNTLKPIHTSNPTPNLILNPTKLKLFHSIGHGPQLDRARLCRRWHHLRMAVAAPTRSDTTLRRTDSDPTMLFGHDGRTIVAPAIYPDARTTYKPPALLADSCDYHLPVITTGYSDELDIARRHTDIDKDFWILA